ncbi:hypothetical protein GY45DRAFT_1372097 [Cubamyces sp. BRFM 1775]|nr:hypothetical protein GY45DRAFT_1372097 [Cubamyces sp. BRFM 1775]
MAPLCYHPALSPPPTSNTLDARQRTRLIRSTRKLGAVLGTTPQLAEDDSPSSSPTLLPITGHGRRSPLRKTSAFNKRRQGSVFELPPPSASPSSPFYDSASSSVSSLSLSRASLESTTSVDSASSLPPAKSFTKHVREKSRSKGKQAPLPTPLVLRLNAVPLPPSDPRVQPPITPDTSATLTFASASTAGSMMPTTPTTPITPTVTETRRKRLAKLKRTLGENVPIELVLPLRSAQNRKTSSTSTSASSSPITPPAAPMVYSPPPAPFTPRPRTANGNAKAPRQQQQQQISKATLPRAQAPRANRRRSMSVDFQTAAQEETVHSPERRSSRVWVTGNGMWTGEWNRKDIREVQQQLRALRVR